MTILKNILRCIFCISVAAAACVVVCSASNGVDSDIISLLFPSGKTLLSSVSKKTANNVNILLEGQDKKTLIDSAKTLSGQWDEKYSLKNTLNKINAYKDGLMSEEVRELISSNKTDLVTQNAISSIFGFTAPLFPIKEDPFFIASSFITSIQRQNESGWSLENGLPIKSDGTNFLALVTLDVAANPIPEILKKIDNGQFKQNKIKVWLGGAPIHAATSESSAKKEINILSVASISLCLLLGFILLRTLKFIPFLLLSLISSFTISTASLFIFFDRPHVLALVFGTSLTGLSVDYTYHAFASKNKETRKHLTFALLTTIACFSPLFFSSASILCQMALFTVSGLLAMYTAVVLFAFDIKVAQNKKNENISETKNRPYILILQVLLALIASSGLSKLKIGNDLNSIYKPTPYLFESEKRIAEAGGQTTSRFIAVKGTSLQDALEREEENKIHGISAIVPSIKKQTENYNFKKILYSKELKNLTSQTGIKPLPLPQNPSFLFPSNLVGTVLENLTRIGIVNTQEAIYLITPTREIKDFADKNISVIEPRKIITDAFNSYTDETIKLISISFGVLSILLFSLFRKRVLHYLLPTAFGVISTLGALGWIGEELNFFHALCLFVFTGLGLDYTIFHLSNSTKLLSRTVFFSFLTSLVGLGMLAFTSFSVTHSMGITFSFGLFFSYFFSIRNRKEPPSSSTEQWFEQKEQSAGKFRIMILWYLYSLAGKNLVKIICFPVIAFIYPFATPAKRAIKKFYSQLDAFEKENNLPRKRKPSTFMHLLSFAWSMVDKTDACTLAKNPPEISFTGGDAKRFVSLIESGKGAMLISSHLGTIEVLPYAKSQSIRNPHVHAFKQLGHNSIFTEILSSKLDKRSLTVHPTEEIGVETAVVMKDAIANGDLVIMAGDRLSASNPNAYLRETFLGKSCKFPKGVYVFAKLMDAPIFFATCVRTSWNKYEIHVEEFNDDLKPKIILQSFTQFLEKETIAHPSEWFHFHDFFVTSES
jgi:predicted LPLAT superfamily acyltransferase